MELNCVIAILDRNHRQQMEKIYRELQVKLNLTMLGKGTATREILRFRGLTGTEKAVMSAVADPETTGRLFRRAEEQLYIDIPGNGIMFCVPIKSAGGMSTLTYLTDKRPGDGKRPEMKFDYELIYVVLNEGHTDEVMGAARPAGAAGGTVISAKGTGILQKEKFEGLSLADEKEVILIVARSSQKASIMQAIMEKAGPQTRAGAICFSLPVTRIAGLRRLTEETENGDGSDMPEAEEPSKASEGANKTETGAEDSENP